MLDAGRPLHELSDYEKLRLEKIRRNEERLAELGLGDGTGPSDPNSQAVPDVPLEPTPLPRVALRKEAAVPIPKACTGVCTTTYVHVYMYLYLYMHVMYIDPHPTPWAVCVYI